MPDRSLPALLASHCVPRRGAADAVDAATARQWLAVLPDWHIDTGTGGIRKAFAFADYFHTMAFVNAVASIAHREDHHPELDVSYNRVAVHYSTHDVGGLSLNDFICAAKVDDLRAG
ncbi:MAG: 4a-hydroxytetrahydrobiopterin dehydratase [Dokdonella sp.]|uniref:4a-hydroxytetrahydrobiopterin dehydratase n=1 Tax=Dokdonella sp. TaxID=2291710 RepID=UPI0025BE92AC|nr:4a-hydroxytetrahydrobiopterin dehydratase [Dokdonella sp.]MBX3700821.1 4a-hydroxytetrahydrobiopterin dehydratase [Dokdonella sp.]MCW5577615.1 4a-hydroxytetrahydrobiopterin dehydratase [Dokdonella sp.]